MVKEPKALYVSPQMKTVEIKAQAIICQSEGTTEQFQMSDYSYDDEDWN